MVDERLNENWSVEYLMSKLSNSFVVGHDQVEEERESGLKEWLDKVFEQEHGKFYAQDLNNGHKWYWHSDQLMAKIVFVNKISIII